MIIESGEIVEIEESAIWVETYQKSTCGKCAAQSGCGQSLLSKFGARASRVKVSVGKEDQQKFVLGQKVQIGIDESAFIVGVLYLYWMPLLFMLIGLWCAHAVGLSEGLSAFFVLAALLLGVFCSRLYAHLRKKSEPLEPVFINCQ